MSLQRARDYLRAIEAGAVGERLAAFYTPDARHQEFPNRLNPHGAETDLAGMLAGAERGQAVLADQRYEVLNAYEAGATVIMEVNWTARLKVPFASLKPGEALRARFAVFIEFEGDRIRRQRNYDCFEPF